MPGHLKKNSSTLRRLIAGLLAFGLISAIAIQQAAAALPGHVT